MKLKKFGLLIIMGLLLYSVFLSVGSGGSLCVIRAVTGIPCPGCGMTRALFALTELNISEAFRQHPLSLMLLPFGMIMILSPFNKGLRTMVLSHLFWQSVIGIFLIVYIIRMILMFPHIEPMTLKEDALLLRIMNLK